jgi:UDP-N-acetylmuramoyl-L-alanine---L-glutamate ligase
LRVRLADLKGRSVAVWGTDDAARAALTAIAAEQPSRLLAVDDRPTYSSIPWDPSLPPLAGGDHAFPALVTADVVVAGPVADHPWLAEIRARGIAVTSGDALWLADHASRTVAVTGSPVATALIAHLLAAFDRPVVTGAPLLTLPAAAEYVISLTPFDCELLTDSPRIAVLTTLTSPGEVNLLRHGPDMIVVNGANLALRDAIRGLTDINRFPPIPAGADDSRFRLEADAVYCSDEVLFPGTALPVPPTDLCVALAVLDGLGIDIVEQKSDVSAAVAAFHPPSTSS